MSHRRSEIKRLHRQRPRRLFVTWSLRVLAAIAPLSWWAGDFHVMGWMTDRRAYNLHRFLQELRPWPVQRHGWDGAAVLEWAAGLSGSKGAEAFMTTLAISVVAIVLTYGLSAEGDANVI